MLATYRSRIREHTRGVDQGPALYALFDPFRNVLVEPLEADGQGAVPPTSFNKRSFRPVRGSQGNVELFAVRVPPVSR